MFILLFLLLFTIGTLYISALINHFIVKNFNISCIKFHQFIVNLTMKLLFTSRIYLITILQVNGKGRHKRLANGKKLNAHHQSMNKTVLIERHMFKKNLTSHNTNSSARLEALHKVKDKNNNIKKLKFVLYSISIHIISSCCSYRRETFSKEEKQDIIMKIHKLF